MTIHSRILSALLHALLLTACAVPGSTPLSTPYPPEYIPTAVALTGQAGFATSLALSPSPEPLALPEATATLIPAVVPSSPTLTPTPEPGFDRFAEMRFLAPGPMSKIVSPLHVQMLIVAGESGIVQLELLGEDGRVLARQVERVNRTAGGAYRSWRIPFDIRAAAEKAWLQVSSEDSFGQVQALNSMPVLLLSIGTNQVNPPGNVIYERVVLLSPLDEDVATGGVLEVRGRIWPMNDEPVFLDLLLPDGQIAGTRVLEFDGIEPQSFDTTIPFKPANGTESTSASPRAARLVVRQMDSVLQIPLYIYSRQVQLGP